ncbi:MAG: ADP-ribosylglycohydrolase family protein [Deltaproteobacteria bacterium]|nr:ADP-ribosylglycohydrolase family protein [Deltaproteobacteria bacterium]
MSGEPVTYDSNGRGAVGDCVGGNPRFAGELNKRDWSKIFENKPWKKDIYGLLRPDSTKIFSHSRILDRAHGCLVGQLAGDNIGALVEFQSTAEIMRKYPGGPREMVDGGRWNILAGQPTDDSELALMLARSIVQSGAYDREAAAKAYAWWYESEPFDIGGTTANALLSASKALQSGARVADAASDAAARKSDSQANGGLMRISPLGIYGHGLEDDKLAELARLDAALTHAHPICQDANAVFCVAIAAGIRGESTPEEVYRHTVDWAGSRNVNSTVLDCLKQARDRGPEDFLAHSGWVLIALWNAFYQLLHAPGPKEGIALTVAAGGDTDTNAAIAGALLGAVHGAEAFPHRWLDRLLTCRPMKGMPSCRHPRPRAFWPVDCLILAERLAWLGAESSRQSLL